MADETPYPDELRLPISITLPRTPRFTPEGRPWPVDETGRDWPSRRGRPVYPVTRLPHGQAPGTGHAPPSSDKRSLMELFAAMDAAMMAESRHAAAVIAARGRQLAAANQTAGRQQPSDPAAVDGPAPGDELPDTPPYEVAAKDLVPPPTPTPLPPGYRPAPGDINLLARTIFSEGSNTSYAYTALGWVIVNRINSKVYGSSDTLAGVVNYPNQFQGIATATYPGNKPWQLSANPRQFTGDNLDSWNEAVSAATQILTGNSRDPTTGATSFYYTNPGNIAESIRLGKLIDVYNDRGWHFLRQSP